MREKETIDGVESSESHDSTDTLIDNALAALKPP